MNDYNEFYQDGEKQYLRGRERGGVMGSAAGTLWGILTFPFALDMFDAESVSDQTHNLSMLLTAALIVTLFIHAMAASDSLSKLQRRRGLIEVFEQGYWRAYGMLFPAWFATVYFLCILLMNNLDGDKRFFWPLVITWFLGVSVCIGIMINAKGRQFEDDKA